MKRKGKQPRPEPPCISCNALCCRHIALEIDPPRTKADFDNIRWYLMHESVKVGMDHDGEWLLEVPLVCRHLKNGQCAIYKKRPELCRAYPGTDDFCEFEDTTSPYKVLFTDERAFERYMAKKKRRARPRHHLHQPPEYGTHVVKPLQIKGVSLTRAILEDRKAQRA